MSKHFPRVTRLDIQFRPDRNLHDRFGQPWHDMTTLNCQRLTYQVTRQNTELNSPSFPNRGAASECIPHSCNSVRTWRLQILFLSFTAKVYSRVHRPTLAATTSREITLKNQTESSAFATDSRQAYITELRRVALPSIIRYGILHAWINNEHAVALSPLTSKFVCY